MKRVLFLKSAPLFPIQGADISMFERMLLLQQHGINGILLASAQRAHRASFEKILSNLSLTFSFDPSEQALKYSYLGIECQMCLGERADQYVAKSSVDIFPLWDNVLQTLRPDFLFGNLRDPYALEYIGNSTFPHLMFLTEDGYPRMGEAHSEKFLQGLKKIKQVAVASSFMQESLKQSYGAQALLFTNAIVTSRYKIKKEAPGDFITLLHPYAHKGLDLFLQLAQAMPERKFLIVAGTGLEYRNRKSELLSYPNLTLLPYSPHITQVYKRSRIVLLPSICQDASPRVVLEAFCSGTPVIGSGTGGMRDNGGEAAFYVPIERAHTNPERFKLDGWLEKITALDNEKFYREICEKALLHVRSFEERLQKSMQALAEVIANSVKA